MPTSPPRKLFIIYAREDQSALLELKAHLRPLEKRGDLTVWYDGEILPGQDWDEAIKAQLEAADIVLLFISKHFFNSEYIERKELKNALERHHKGDVIVVPVIIKHCVWDAYPEISGFQALPKDAKPVASWGNIDEAWENVVRGVLKIINQPGIEEDKFPIFENAHSQHIGETIQSVLRQTEEQSCNIQLPGVPSGLIDLDRLTLGWQPSDLIIIASRPSMGKSSMMLTLALNAARDFDKSVAVFSLEMNKIQLANRVISMMTQIPVSKILSGKLEDYEWQQLQTIKDQIIKIPIFIDDTPSINIFELRARCRKLKVQNDIKLIIIDHLQLITSGTEEVINANREQELSAITQGLKNTARELNIPIIVFSQIGRNVEIRGGSKRPQLSDIRELGPIETDANIIGFIYRPEYYQILEDEYGQNLKGIAEFIIAKHSHGALDTIRLKFDDTFSKFYNLGDDPFLQPLKSPFLSPKITHTSRMNDEDIPF